MNKYLRTVVLAPLTTSSKNYPTRIEINQESKIGWIILDQIRTVSKERIVKPLGALSKSQIKLLKSAIQETYVN